MPIYLPPISRRRFLAGSLAAGVSALLPNGIFAKEASEASPHLLRLLLMSDTHIPAKHKSENHGTRPVEHFERAVEKILALKEPCRHAIVTGDCAFERGEQGDYRTFNELLHPIRKEMGVWLTVGNHDHRKTFLEAFPDARKVGNAEAHEFDKFAYLEKTGFGNLIFLDSLHITHNGNGLLGEAQLHWLAKTLDAHPDRPAILFGHHNPTPHPAKNMNDMEAFLDVIGPRKQVKAYIYGHTHAWKLSEHEGVHLINIPTVSAWKDASEPRGFVVAELAEAGITVTLHAEDHAKHGEKKELSWRAG